MDAVKRYGGAAIQRQSAAVQSLLATVGDGIAKEKKTWTVRLSTKELLSMETKARPINTPMSSSCAVLQISSDLY